MKLDEQLVHAARRQLPLPHEPRAVVLDRLGGDGLHRRAPELGQQVRIQRAPVPHDRRPPPLAVQLDVAQPLGGYVGERRTRLDSSRQLPALGCREDAAQLGLGGLARVVALRWAPALGPRGAEQLLHLLTIGEAVLRVPLVAALALYELDVAGHVAGSHQAAPHGRA